MPLKTIASFKVSYLQILDENGKADAKLVPKLKPEEIKRMYELMVLSRVFDDKALALQRQGRIGTYAPVRGEEACQVGSAILLEKNDWLFPSFREAAAFITRGIAMHTIFQYWAGDERGSNMPKGNNTFTVSIPVGSHMLHAVGAAMAAKIRKEKTIAMTYFGDGATSEGDFHEACNFAGVYKAPVVFVCQNNQYAISMPVSLQTASQTIAQKAIAYGFDGIQVDGNDVFAVYKAAKEAIEKARAGKGPTLIECFTYRMGDHTTSDDASRYRTKEEVEAWARKDPILRLEKFMAEKGLWSKKYGEKVLEDSKKKVEEAVKMMESVPAPAIEDIFGYTYAEMPAHLKEQLAELKEEISERDKAQTG
ncbi:MAG: pyruvate dehydrogenase (acetyl-transferring) E1 component subunit alpha [Candidatus Aenigmarchaeota archaeon]|nr:pyruvate dehydrogenase (acetyl-transferring) E1 component subunit alpha [Candidatus Aenigmarchaeota archaeon]